MKKINKILVTVILVNCLTGNLFENHISSNLIRHKENLDTVTAQEQLSQSQNDVESMMIEIAKWGIVGAVTLSIIKNLKQ